MGVCQSSKSEKDHSDPALARKQVKGTERGSSIAKLNKSKGGKFKKVKQKTEVVGEGLAVR